MQYHPLQFVHYQFVIEVIIVHLQLLVQLLRYFINVKAIA